MENNKQFPSSLTLATFSLLFIILNVTLARVTYDASHMPPHRISLTRVDSNYTPEGTTFILPSRNLTIYESPASNPQRVLIAVHDIFAFSNDNVKQVSDRIAEQNGNFTVVLPDFFRGDSWDKNNYPPNLEELQTWVNQVGNWEERVKPDLLALIEEYTQRGAKHFGIFGWCWGGKVSTLASSDNDLKGNLSAAGLVHPVFVTNDEAPGVQVPMYLMPSRDEPDMLPFYEVLKSKFGENCGHKRFDDMAHGFAAGTADFNDPKTVEKVHEVISILGDFFNANLPESP